MAKLPDIVCLTTPVCYRDEYWERLAREQCFILAEKPVYGDDLSLPYFDAVKDRCTVDFQLRGLEQFQIVAKMINEGTLGDICSIDLFERTAALRADSLPSWMTTPDLGGGQRMAMGSHLLDLAVFLLGGNYSSVQEFQCSAETRRGSWRGALPKGQRPSDECFDCSFMMNQARVAIRTTSISRATRSLEFRVERKGWQNSAIVTDLVLCDYSTRMVVRCCTPTRMHLQYTRSLLIHWITRSFALHTTDILRQCAIGLKARTRAFWPH